MTIEQYINTNYPSIREEYIRLSTPFYYEPGVLYHPIQGGFGTSGPSKKEFMLVDADYLANGERFINMIGVINKKDRYIATGSKIHQQLKRVDESISPTGREFPNTKRIMYVSHKGVIYEVIQAYWREYKTNRLGGRVTIWLWNEHEKDEDRIHKKPYWTLYSYFGSKWHMQHIKSYDSVGRENNEYKMNTSVRAFKQYVFGDANVKLKCSKFPK